MVTGTVFFFEDFLDVVFFFARIIPFLLMETYFLAPEVRDILYLAGVAVILSRNFSPFFKVRVVPLFRAFFPFFGIVTFRVVFFSFFLAFATALYDFVNADDVIEIQLSLVLSNKVENPSGRAFVVPAA